MHSDCPAQLLQLVGCDKSGCSGQPQHISQRAEIHKQGCLLATTYTVSKNYSWSHERTSTQDYIHAALKLVLAACWIIFRNISKGHTIQQHAGVWNVFNLAALVAGANPQLVDLCFGHVSPLFCIIELMLELPVLGQVGVCLLLLQRANQGKQNYVQRASGADTVQLIFIYINQSGSLSY